MSTVSLKTNIASLSTQRYLTRNASEANASLERLSTGLRINRASDDAAGLAISSKLNVDERVFNQGVRNVNDAVSVLNVAQGAAESLTTILTRLKELTEQSANGTLALQQRKAINEEADEMVREYNRIVGSVEFNGRVLLDGDFNQLGVQAGYGTDGAVVFNLGEDLARNEGNGAFTLSTTLAGGSTDQQVEVADINEDGNLDLISTSSADTNVNVQLGNGDGTFGTLTAYSTGLNGAGPLSVSDFNGDGKLDVLVLRAGNLTNTANEASIMRGNGDGTFQAATAFSAIAGSLAYSNRQIAVGDLDGDGDLDFGFTGALAMSGQLYFQTVLNNGNGTFAIGSALPQQGLNVFTSSSIAFADLNGDDKLDAIYSYGDNRDYIDVALGNGNGTFGASTHYAGGNDPEVIGLADINRDGFLDLLGTNTSANGLRIRFGNGDGTFGAAMDQNASGERIEDVNGDGLLDLLRGSAGSIYTYFGNGDGTFASAVVSSGAGAATSRIRAGDFNNDGTLDAVMIGNNNLYVFSAVPDHITAMPFLDLLSQQDALNQFSTINEAFARVAKEVSNIGANQSRLNSVVNVLSQMRQESAAAKSRIVDADVADESSKIVRFQILQQAGAGVLAQANQAPELALTLLNQL